MKRTVKKQFWFSKVEAQDLKKKAKKACLTEAALIRLLLRGYEPREKPDERFYDAMRELSAIGNNINQLAIKANALGFVDSQMLKNASDGISFHIIHPPLTRTKSASPLPVPKEFMADPQKVGFGIAKHIFSKRFIICHSFSQKFQTLICYLCPIKMGKLMSKMTVRYVNDKKG